MLEFARDNILLIAVAVVSGVMLILPLLRRGGGGGGHSVDTLRATQCINREDALVVDVRDAAEVAQGKILGARAVPLAQLGERGPELRKNKEKPIIVYCGRGNQSQQAAAILRKQGYANVFNLSGGFAAWLQAGLPIEK
ncbi:MAG: rhodanese-like domain-containing protein [Betaproteobacteria bacterium]|jgi:rhodanese-related sulfurtransferase|nr:rhodanese-like domain-containing protein [Betaproteobacteria bacterium]